MGETVTIGVSCFAGDGGRSGIGRYFVSLLREFETLARPDERFEIAVTAGERDLFLVADPRFRVLEVTDALGRPVLNVGWHLTALWVVARRRRWDVAFLPAANRRLPFAMPCPTVGTVHDLASLHVPGKYDLVRTLYITRVLPVLMRRLTRVIVPSESTRDDVVRAVRVPAERVEVIPHGVDESRFRPRDASAAGERLAGRLGIRKPYLLYVSRIEHPGKNHVGLIRAFERLKASGHVPHRLVLAGGDWSGAEEVHRVANGSSVREDIVFTGFVDPADLPDLYAAADAVVFPSLYEGFGLPVLEAMACGVLVACSDRSSLPEVTGDAALLFDPGDVEAMAGVIRRLVVDADLRRDLAARGLGRCREFTWRRTAERTIELIREAAGSGRGEADDFR